ncbi:MAG: HD domain-containing protein [Chthonomonas sp.]|nr:HD domain-containing protein [Chthonomonas sp.]
MQLPENFLDRPALIAIREATLGTQFEGRVWLVGGAVRDALLGRPGGKDLDLAVEGDAQALAQLLFERGASSIYPVIFERFGTAQVIVADEPVELVCTRREQYEPHSRKPIVEFGTLEEDAMRRDFTINALFVSLHSGAILDPTDRGLADLSARILRTPLEPRRTFSEDPLRMLRAVRFRAQLGFEFAPDIEPAILAVADRLKVISQERIREELLKMLATPSPSESIEALSRLGLLRQFLPELESCRFVEQGPYHHLDVWGHSLLVLDNIASENIYLRLAGLLHDIGKPQTRFVDNDGRTRFFTHEVVGADMVRQILGRMKFSNDEIAYVELLVRQHMRFGHNTISATAARRALRALGPHMEDLLILCQADANSHHPDAPHLDVPAIRAKIREVQAATPAESLQSPLDGHEILAIDPSLPGKVIGQIKAFLLEEVLKGRLLPEDRAAAEELTRRWLSHHRGQ